MVTSFIMAIAVFVMSVFFIGTTQALWLAGLVLGFALLVVGLRMIFSVAFREKYYRTYMNDPEWERTHSKSEKDFMNQYFYPSRPILAGIGLIGLYWASHIQLINAIVSWFMKLF